MVMRNHVLRCCVVGYELLKYELLGYGALRC